MKKLLFMLLFSKKEIELIGEGLIYGEGHWFSEFSKTGYEKINLNNRRLAYYDLRKKLFGDDLTPINSK